MSRLSAEEGDILHPEMHSDDDGSLLLPYIWSSSKASCRTSSVAIGNEDSASSTSAHDADQPEEKRLLYPIILKLVTRRTRTVSLILRFIERLDDLSR